MNKELIFGIHPIVELLKAKKRKLYTIYTIKPAPKSWSQIEPLLSKNGTRPTVQIQYVTKDVLNRIAQTTDHQSVVALASPFEIKRKFFDPIKNPFLVMLDGIQDPRNLGAILRTSYCTGFTGIILCRKGGVGLNATVLKASAGLAEHLDVYEAPTAQAAIQELKAAKYNIWLATLNGSDATHEIYKEPLCLVIGNEATGISKSILSSGKQIKLPQKTTDISYNASVAAGILLFMIAHQNKII